MPMPSAPSTTANGKSSKAPAIYKVDKLYLAAYLMACGEELAGHEGTADNVVFLFRSTPILPDLIHSFWNDRTTSDIRARAIGEFIDALGLCKGIISNLRAQEVGSCLKT